MSSYGFIKELIEKEHTPTPAYVFDLDKMKEFVKKVQSCLGESAQLCYAMKANPFLTGPMMDVVPTFEVCSPGEFRICERVGVPDELGEAALIDGASTWQEYLYVRIPYIKPVIIANCLLVLNGSLRSFEFSYLLTHGGPGNASELMTTYMYKQAFSSMKYGYGSSVAIMIVIICMVVGMLFRKFTGGGDDE